MTFKKAVISVLLISALAVTIMLPVFADNIILIQDSYYYSDDWQYMTSQCATSAGEAQRHRAVAKVSSIWQTEFGYGNIHPFHSNASKTIYVGNHADSHCNYYQLESEINN